jgi:methyltransferase (TIGR00027 family)
MNEVLPPGVVEATATLLVESGAVGRGAVRFSQSRTAVGIYLAFEWMMPGQFEAFAHRKAFCERQVRESIESGAGQVLVLGAGYDTLGWRLASEYPKVNFFEIDHPATISLKANGIQAMEQRDNHYLLAEDLSKRQLIDVLRSNVVWDSTMTSIIIAEGLLMYLPSDAVGSLFEQCAAVSGAGSRFAFTYVGTRANGQPDAGPWSWLVLWLLKASGEPWIWSIKPDVLNAFLNQHHWKAAPKLAPAPNRHGVEFFGLAVK